MQRRTPTADETERLGALLAASRPIGADMPAIIYLSGELGAGKTTLARGFARGCGVQGAVRSPTYTLVELYELAGVSILHIDLYRLGAGDEAESLGLREWLRPDTVWLVEWPERAAGHLPPADLVVTLRAEPTGHEIALSPGSELGTRWLARTFSKVEMTLPRT